MTRHGVEINSVCKLLLSFYLLMGQYSPLAAEEADPGLIFIDAAHRTLSQEILGLSNRIDSFFGDPRIDDEVNDTRVRLFNETYFRESAGPANLTGFRAQLRLPKTERRLQLIVRRDDEEEENDTLQSQTPNTNPTAGQPRQEDTSAGLRYLLDMADIRLSTDVGIAVDQWPPAAFGRLRARKRFLFGEWIFRPIEIIRWEDREGWSSRTDLDFDRRINDTWLFRFDNRVTWTDQDHIPRAQSGPAIFQKLTEEIALQYTATAFYEDNPEWSVTNYILAVGYRQLLYKKWFFWQISPNLSFPREENFHRIPGAVIKFEAIFGRI